MYTEVASDMGATTDGRSGTTEEYELTPLGRGLTEPVLGLVSWLQSNWPAIRSARDRFDARKKATRTVAQSVASATIRG
jgi:hypothetical protein